MADVYALSEGDVGVLRELVAAYRSGLLTRPNPSGRYLEQRSEIMFGIVDATITGTTGSATTPGSGTLSVFNFTSTGGTTDSGNNETVYNASATDATTAEWTVCVRDFQSGNWIISRENS
jgi:hypothetical protein